MKTNETEKKEFKEVICPCCGCVTLVETKYYEQRCGVCRNYFEFGFQTFSEGGK